MQHKIVVFIMLQKKRAEHYIDRDISWMYFNSRILQEVSRPQVPLLERLTFLGIYSNNLDEFFRVRMAYLSRVAEVQDGTKIKTGQDAKKVIKKISALNARYAEQFDVCIPQINEELKAEHIHIVTDQELTSQQHRFIYNFFCERLNGFISPIWFAAVKFFDVETDENIYLAVKMKKAGEENACDYAYIELPVRLCGRFVRLPDSDGQCYLMYVDDVVRSCLPFVFEGQNFTSFEAYAFKFTRDAEMDNDLRSGRIQKIAQGIKSRRRGEPLRVIYDEKMPRTC